MWPHSAPSPPPPIRLWIDLPWEIKLINYLGKHSVRTSPNENTNRVPELKGSRETLTRFDNILKLEGIWSYVCDRLACVNFCVVYIQYQYCLVPSRFQRGERKTRKNSLFQYPIMHCPAMISQPLIYIDCNCTALCPTKGLRRRQVSV